MDIDNEDILEEWPDIASQLNDADGEMVEGFEKKTGFNIETDRFPGRRYGDMEREKWVPHEILDNFGTLEEVGELDNILVGKTVPMDVVFGSSRLGMRKIGGEQIEAIQESTGSFQEYKNSERDDEHSVIIREETLPSDNLRPITTAEEYDFPIAIPEDYTESLRDLGEKLEDGEYSVNPERLADGIEERTRVLDALDEDYDILEIADVMSGNTGVLIYSGSTQEEWEKGEYDTVIPLTPEMADHHIQHTNEEYS